VRTIEERQPLKRNVVEGGGGALCPVRLGPDLDHSAIILQPLDRSHDNFINSSFASSTLRHVSPQTFAPPSFFVSFFFLTLSMDLINLIHGLISQKKNNSKMIKACMTCR
jgi:hypothetical protein